MEGLFWLAIGALVFTYLGYPALMGARALARPQPIHARPQTPQTDVLLVVHNGADWLGAKLTNLLALDYPPERLNIHIACDGCTDATEAIARGYANPRIQVHAFSERCGKSACIGQVLPLLKADMVVFTDVRQLVDPGAVRALAAALSDSSVGAVSGELVFETSSGHGKGIAAYWRYEKWVRRLESASGSLVGVTGALYAIRRSALFEVPPGLILDDMWVPLAIAGRGYRVVFVEQARVYDHCNGDARSEQIRKRRTLSGNYQLLHRWPRLALPGAHPLAWRLWGHKWLRLLAPWLLLVILFTNMGIASGSSLYATLLWLQLGGYGLAAASRLYPDALGQWLPARLADAFISLNMSALLALADYIRNPHAHLWQSAAQRLPTR